MKETPGKRKEEKKEMVERNKHSNIKVNLKRTQKLQKIYKFNQFVNGGKKLCARLSKIF